MAIFRQVYIDFWTDSKVSDNFTPEDRYFMLFLLTNPSTNMIGCYEIRIVNLMRVSLKWGYVKLFFYGVT